MPVLTHQERDAGPYFTTGVVIAKDPETGIRGMGIHRIQVKGPRTLGILLNNPPVAAFLEKAEKRGDPLEIAIALGLDPVTFFSSIIWAPQGIDKFDIAGGLLERPVPLVRCESVDLEVPARAEFVLEGRVLPGRREPEGPLGESTGYYFTFNNPVIEVQAVTHRNDPVYHALMPFAGEEEVLINFSWQMENRLSFLEAIPGLKDISLKHLGLITVAQVAKRQEGDGRRVIEALFDAGIPNKIVIAVDEDVNIADMGDVWWAMATRFQPARDVIIKEGLRGLRIDPSATEQAGGASGSGRPEVVSSKIGLDATKPLDQWKKFDRIGVPPKVRERVAALLAKRFPSQARS
jgi:2,5-furandicarboxylate decarboxylase 1